MYVQCWVVGRDGMGRGREWEGMGWVVAGIFDLAGIYWIPFFSLAYASVFLQAYCA